MPITADDATDVPEPGPPAAAGEPRRPANMPARCTAEGEVLSRADIESRFPSEWVLVGDPELDEHLRVVRGTILWHSKDRDEVDWKDMELRPRHSASFYNESAAERDDDTAIVL